MLNWQPQPEGLAQLTQLLKDSMSPNNAVQTQVREVQVFASLFYRCCSRGIDRAQIARERFFFSYCWKIRHQMMNVIVVLAC